MLISPLGESALFVSVVGLAIHPLPNDTIRLSISAKETITHNLLVYNLTEVIKMYLHSFLSTMTILFQSQNVQYAIIFVGS